MVKTARNTDNPSPAWRANGSPAASAGGLVHGQMVFACGASNMHQQLIEERRGKVEKLVAWCAVLPLA